METTLTTTYTQAELDGNYGDDLFAHDDLTNQFKEDNPDANITSTVGSSEDNEDGTYTYTITIRYE